MVFHDHDYVAIRKKLCMLPSPLFPCIPLVDGVSIHVDEPRAGRLARRVEVEPLLCLPFDVHKHIRLLAVWVVGAVHVAERLQLLDLERS